MRGTPLRMISDHITIMKMPWMQDLSNKRSSQHTYDKLNNISLTPWTEFSHIQYSSLHYFRPYLRKKFKQTVFIIATAFVTVGLRMKHPWQ